MVSTSRGAIAKAFGFDTGLATTALLRHKSQKIIDFVRKYGSVRENDLLSLFYLWLSNS